MKFVRYSPKNSQEAPRTGWILDDRVGSIDGSIFGEFRREDTVLPLSAVRLHVPILPGKILCVGRNYVAHAKEHGAEVPEVPMLFMKPATTLLPPDGTILLPPQSQQVEHEAELVIVIGKRGRWIPPEHANQYILGYTVGNDVTARDLQRRDGQWTRAKGFDTFCPLGPYIETDFDPSDAMITCHVNSEMRQMASTRDMVFRVDHLLAFASSIMTLEPGDIIMTGTPAGVGPLKPGDIVEASVEGLGILRNSVSAEPAR